MIPDSTWLYEQARALSSDKSDDAVGALAWNLAVAFRRWSERPDQKTPLSAGEAEAPGGKTQ